MSVKTYTDKEDARMALENALRIYVQAAKYDSLDNCEMAEEIGNAINEAGLHSEVLTF